MSDSEREIDALVAEKVFGWKWLAWIGIPIKGTPTYPQKQLCRTFVSPKQQEFMRTSQQWVYRWADSGDELRDATGEEPLAYCYCSSRGYEMWPMPTKSAEDDYEVLKHVRKRWGKAEQREFNNYLLPASEYRVGDYARAALAALAATEAGK